MKNKIKYLPISILTLTTVASGAALSSGGTLAVTSGSKTAAVTVTSACSFSSVSGNVANLDVTPGGISNTQDSDRSSVVSCNNPLGFEVQAVGFAPDADHAEGYEGNTAMYGPNGTIPTGTSGTDSYWSFKTRVIHATTTATVTPGYGEYSEVPDTAVKILDVAGATGSSVMGIFRTDYQAHVSASQPTGSYSGKVKYTIVNGA